MLGEIELTVGAGLLAVYVNPSLSVPLCVSVLVTTTFTAPAACAAVVAVIDVLLPTTTPVAAVPPSFTVAPAKESSACDCHRRAAIWLSRRWATSHSPSAPDSPPNLVRWRGKWPSASPRSRTAWSPSRYSSPCC